MRGLSKQAEHDVLAAIDDVERCIDAGEHPTSAVVKVATARGLSPGHTRLVATAWNTGRTALQRDSHDDTVAKAAAFELADPDIACLLVSRQQKTAAVEAPQPISTEYDKPPTFATDRYTQEKLAAVVVPPLVVRDVAPMTVSHEDDIYKAQARARGVEQKIAEAVSLCEKAERDLHGHLDRTVTLFTATGAPTVATLRKVAEIRQDAGHLAVLRELVRRCPRLEKAAASVQPVLTGDEQRLYAKIGECVDMCRRVNVANKNTETIINRGRAKIAALLSPHDRPFRPLQGAFDDINAGAEKTAAGGMWNSLLGSFTGARLAKSTEPESDEIKAHLMALDDPAHNQRLDAIRARTTLETLMAQDPVLKGYPQDQVVDAYNSISQAAPRTASQPLYMQAMLRRHLGQGGMLDPDDVRSNVMGVDKELGTVPAQPAAPDLIATPSRRGTSPMAAASEAFSAFSPFN